jgi:DNA-binding NtrC family response regulator
VIGEGSCFRVSIPAIVGEACLPQPTLAREAQASLREKRVYVVDDEQDILNSMRILLGVWEISVYTADSSAGAERLFEQHGPPDLLIIDLRMGEAQHGARLADQWQQTYGHFPVLIITGETSSEALRQANERSYALLQKPIDPDVLRREIVAATTTAVAAVTRPS